MNKAVLIYDGECPLCQGSVRLVRSRIRSGELELLPFQAPDRAARYPELTEEACQQGIQLVLPDGRAVAGSEAVPETLARLRGWRWLSHVLRTPGVKLLVRYLYRWIARNRYTLSRVLASLSLAPTVGRGRSVLRPHTTDEERGSGQSPVLPHRLG